MGVNPFVCVSCGNEIGQMSPYVLVDGEGDHWNARRKCEPCHLKDTRVSEGWDGGLLAVLMGLGDTHTEIGALKDKEQEQDEARYEFLGELQGHTHMAYIPLHITPVRR